MTENTNNTTARQNNWFGFLYRTRIKIHKQDTCIINLSLIFTVLAALSAPWVAVAGLIVSLALGYRFSIERNAAAFTDDFDQVVREAAGNVKAVVNSVVKEEKAE